MYSVQCLVCLLHYYAFVWFHFPLLRKYDFKCIHRSLIIFLRIDYESISLLVSYIGFDLRRSIHTTHNWTYNNMGFASCKYQNLFFIFFVFISNEWFIDSLWSLKRSLLFSSWPVDLIVVLLASHLTIIIAVGKKHLKQYPYLTLKREEFYLSKHVWLSFNETAWHATRTHKWRLLNFGVRITRQQSLFFHLFFGSKMSTRKRKKQLIKRWLRIKIKFMANKNQLGANVKCIFHCTPI